MPDRPNLLFIFTDQQRADTMRAYGNNWIQTPNLDRLADSSFVFENAYVSTPICTPSRSTIMTGTWPHTNGCLKNNIPLRDDIDTVADMLPDDYHRAYYGKWHLGDEVIKRRGWDEWHSIEDQYRIWHTDAKHDDALSDYHHYLVSQGFKPNKESRGKKVFSRPFAAALPEEHTKASYLSRQVSKFIHDNKDRPWALYVNILEPHPPYDGPFNDMYDPASLPQSPVFMKDPPANASRMATLMAAASKGRAAGTADAAALHGRDLPPEELAGEGPVAYSEEAFRDIQARYYGLVTLVDKAIGRILDALDESGQVDNTIVVFSAEHGDQLGEYNIFQKIVMYETTVRVPMLVRVPWLSKEQVRVPGRYSHIDTVPTLLDLLGLEQHPQLQGTSRADVLRGEGTLQGNDVVLDWNGRSLDLKYPLSELEKVREIPHRCLISSDGWKLNLAVGDNCELYDMNSDPYEQVNLFNNPAHAGRIKDMAARLRQWQMATQDTAALPDV